MKSFCIGLLTIGLATSVFAKGSGASKEKMIKKMASACKAELAKEPALTDKRDGESIWKNLEDKEHGQVKISKNCHNAHEAYEHKFHKGEENEATETH
jgi:hypothetical protein